MNRLHAMNILIGICMCLWVGAPALSDEPIIPIYVGCGFAYNWAACEGCADTADDCHCDESLDRCATNHRVCFEEYRAFDDCDEYPCVDVYKARVRCYKRYQCNNLSGEDEGNCGVSGQCTTSEE